MTTGTRLDSDVEPPASRSRPRLAIVALTVLVAVLAAAGIALGAIGDLTNPSCIKDVAAGECGAAAEGLNGAAEIAVSPDGKSVYTTGNTDDTLANFDRNVATGALSNPRCIKDNVAGECGSAAAGLNTPRGVAVSPDGKSVYVVTEDDKTIVTFDRDTTDPGLGDLSNPSCIKDNVAGECGAAAAGLDTPTSVAVSADGKSVYVVSFFDDTIVTFDRNVSTGALSSASCIKDVAAGECAASAEGLNGAYAVTVSPDDKSVYVASELDDAIARFDRNLTTGALSNPSCIKDVAAGECGAAAEGLNGVHGIAVSPDGKSVYTAANVDDAIARFDRNLTTGALSNPSCIKDVAAGECGAAAQGLDGASSVTVSSDDLSVYTAAIVDDAIARFDRNLTTGALSNPSCIKDAVAGECGGSAQGLNGAFYAAVSPEGTSLYAVSGGDDDAVVLFDREPGDIVPPQTTIDSGPIGLTNDTTPTYGFSADEIGSTFECRFDADPFAACSGPGATHTPGVALAQGAHSFEVRATDVAANTDPTPASQALTVDSLAPQTTIDSGPTGTTSDATPTYAFSSDEPGSTFQCRFDGSPFAACSGPGATHTPGSSLADGAHTFEVRATDPSGNTDATAASRNFAVDTDPPETKLKTKRKSAKVTFAFSSDESGGSFECALDKEAFAPCTSPLKRKVKKGKHTFSVRALDAAGNVDATPATATFKVKRKRKR